ncbi:MAG: hypothetical protein J0I52_02760 [Bordetella sp.]|nr:hypothetical protein [Bordetella sp.]
MLAMSPIYLFTLAFFLLTALVAVWRGGPWQRAASAVMGIAWIVSNVVPFDYRSPPWGAVSADSLVFLFLLYGASRSRTWWMPAAAGFQFLVLATHYVFITDIRLEQWAYVSAYYVWNIGLITTLFLSCLRHGRTGRAAPAAMPAKD